MYDKINDIELLREILKLKDKINQVLSIDDFICRLNKFNNKTEILTDIGYTLYNYADSYRGYYKDLFIDASSNIRIDYNKPKIKNTGEIITLLQFALDVGEMEGYKGGVFPVNENTLVWFSQYGNASGIYPIELIEYDSKCLILTSKEN